jgi:hypothetical protein
MNLIYIPSSDRPQRQSTLQALPPSLWPRVRLVVQQGQRAAYDAAQWPVKLLVLPPHVNRLGPTLGWINSHARTHSPQAYYALDDDIKFLWRDDKLKLHPSTHEQTEAMFSMFDQWLEHKGIGAVSVSARFGNNFHPQRSRTGAIRISQFLGYRTAATLNVKFGRVLVYTDQDVTLQILALGYACRVSYGYAYQETVKYQGAGGCSVYRTAEVEDEFARKMVQLHAPFTKLKFVKDRRWGGREMARATFQWKKIWLNGLPEELQ